MATLLRRGCSAPLMCLAAAACGTAGCSGHSTASAAPATVSQSPPSASATEDVADGRFTVVLSSQALQHASAAGINLGDLITRALGQINAVLPGPKTTITVSYAPPADLIPQTGTFGYTNPSSGQITSAFGPTPQVSIKHALTVGLPRGLAHEVNHSVRIIIGPVFGTTLLAQIITEGIATEFDQLPSPGRPTPGLRPSRQPRNAPCGKRHSPSSMPQAFTTLGCSAGQASRTGPRSPSATTSSTTIGAAIQI